MPEHEPELEGKLQNLAARLQRGWAKLHPVTEAQRLAVQRAVRERWEQRAEAKGGHKKTRPAKKHRAKTRTKQMEESSTQKQQQQGKPQSHGQGHSH